MTEPDPDPEKASPWSPLRIRVFRGLWIAGLASNVGTFMHGVGASWLMTTLTRSPSQVALLQTATAVPAFCLALPAGALADVVDRRRLLLATQALMLVAAGLLGVLTLRDVTTPGLLLAFTVVLGAGSALSLPAWVSITPELVPRPELPAAVTLNAIGMNAAAALGPAAGGLVLAGAGPEWVFLLNAASFLAILVAVGRWHREAPTTTLPAEHVTSAMRAGLRYVGHAPTVQIVLVKAWLFMFSSSALTALLPLVARARLDGSAGQFGILAAALGSGAVLAGLGLPKARAVLSIDAMILVAAAGGAVALAIMATTHTLAVAAGALVLAGAASIAFMSTMTVTLQSVLASWVRGRTVAVFMLVVQGATALGAILWGILAQATSLQVSLTCGAVSLIGTAVLTSPLRLAGRDDVDPTPAGLWPDPVVMIEHGEDDGPVLIEIEWRVRPDEVAAFVTAMRAVGRQRRRDGGMRWGLYEDMTDPGRMVESFTVATWAEHERQHGRVTTSDAEEMAPALAFLLDGDGPRTTHFLHPRRHVNGAAAAAAAHHATITLATTRP